MCRDCLTREGGGGNDGRVAQAINGNGRCTDHTHRRPARKKALPDCKYLISCHLKAVNLIYIEKIIRTRKYDCG